MSAVNVLTRDVEVVLMCNGAKSGVFWIAMSIAVRSAACLFVGAILALIGVTAIPLSSLMPQLERGSLFFLFRCELSMCASVLSSSISAPLGVCIPALWPGSLGR